MVVNLPAGGAAWPYLFHPQHRAVLSVRRPQVWLPPALTEMYIWFGSAGSAACSNSLATRAWPCMTALSKGVSPQLSTMFGTAPWANNSDATCSWPNHAARCSGVLRRALITSGSAPCSSSRSTTRACPCRAAWCSAVSPFLSTALGFAPSASRRATASVSPFPAAVCKDAKEVPGDAEVAGTFGGVALPFPL